MGPPNSKQSSAYVPPQTEGNSTLLGGGVLPAADVRGDLNRTPATTVELQFEPISSQSRLVGSGDQSTGFHHGYIVVRDNRTGKQWVSEAGPSGRNVYGHLPGGSVRASTHDEDSGVRAGSKNVARLLTEEPAEQVAQRLREFSAAFSERNLPYDLPVPMPTYPYALPTQRTWPVRNSNYYAGAVWEHLRGELPSLPSGINAPGWGDHRNQGPR